MMNLKCTLVCTLVALLSTFAPAQIGTPDSTFGQIGVVATPFYYGFDYAGMVRELPDGKILFTGIAWNGSLPELFIIKHLPDGSYDTDFGNNGKKVVTFPGVYPHEVNDMDVLSDGSIVICGSIYYQPATPRMAVFKLDAAGDIDTTFGTNGFTTYTYPDANTILKEMAVQPDGKIVAAGTLYTALTRDAIVVRLNANGSFDNTFNGTGRYQLDASGRHNGANTVALQSDGKIVIGGFTIGQTSGFDQFLARFNANGSLDGTFGNGGTVTTDFANGDEEITSIAIQNNGRILAGGYANNNFSVSRYLANGLADNTYPNGGHVFYNFGSTDKGSKLLLQPDGKVVIAGTTLEGFYLDLGVLRLLTNGEVDSTFGTNGVTQLEFFRNMQVKGISIQDDGNILIAGEVNNIGDISVMVIKLKGDSPVGIVSTTNAVNGLSVYPNPVSSGKPIKVDFTMEKAQDISVTVKGIDGRSVGQSNLKGLPAGQNQFILPVPEFLPAGVYIVSIASGSGTSMFRVVVQ